MSNWLKIAVKAGLALAISALIFVLLTTVKIPKVDLKIFSQLGMFIAVAQHYCPALIVLLPFVFGLLAFELALRGVRLSLVAIKWVMKVNE
jgi:hypothetical protein